MHHWCIFLNPNNAKALVVCRVDFFPARLATLPYGLDSNVTQLVNQTICILLFANCTLLLLLLLLLKKVSSARLGESDIHPISPKAPAPQYQPIDRKKRKGKRVEDYSRDRAA